MTAIASTAVRDTKQFGFNPVPAAYEGTICPVKGAVNCRLGGIAVIGPGATHAGGYYQPATAATGLRAMGIFQRSFDNTNGADGASDSEGFTGAQVRSGVWLLASGTSADAITQLNVGAMAYLIDDQTVGATDGGGARSPAGPILAIDPVSGLPFVGLGPQFTATAANIYANAKIQVVTGVTLTSGTKGVTGAGAPAGTAFSLTASSVIVPVLVNPNTSTGLGAQYVISAITTGIAGTAAFTVTATAAGGTTVTADVSTLAFLIIG